MLKVRLKEVLNRYGYTVYDLSDAILDVEGISESTVYRFARGEQNLTLKKLELILSAVRALTGQPVGLHDLIGDDADTLLPPSLTAAGDANAEPVIQASPSDLVLFSKEKTAEEIEDVWELIALAQRPKRRASTSLVRRWLLGVGGLALVGLALLAAPIAQRGSDVAAFLIRPGVFTPSERAIQVMQGSDDAEESLVSGLVHRDSNDLELVNDAAQNGQQIVGVRFQNVELSPGTTVDAAYIEFKADGSDSGPTSITIRGEASDAPDSFRTTTANLSQRRVTTAAVTWRSIAPWEAGQSYRTPDLSPIVQEIVDRNGWSSGNPIVFIITGSGKRTAESFESKPDDAPLLRVEFTP